MKPDFQITENSITVILPIQKESIELSDDERRLIGLLDGGRMLSSREAAETLGWGKDKSIRLMKGLIAKNQVKAVEPGEAQNIR
ncbi:MAG: hypothetical protein K6E30_08725 [Lachnospiraceae bacterium]|nr:hypothetical protein [Lachnospiraceae bacterium]